MEKKPLSYKLTVLVFLMVIGGILSSVVSMILLYAFSENQNLSELMQIETLTTNRIYLLQTISVFGTFWVPAFLFQKIFNKKIIDFKKFPIIEHGFLAILIILSAVPIINWLAELNSQFHLPKFLSYVENWMRESEEKAEILTNKLLAANTFGGYLLNVCVVGVLAAISEELFFRGIIQKLLSNNTNRIHFSIWITAILFSAIHLQFFGFVPRVLLGALLGYLYYWSGSLWLPILAHFTNNFMAVTMAYLIAINKLDFDIDSLGTNGLLSPIFSLALVGFLLYYFYKYRRVSI